MTFWIKYRDEPLVIPGADWKLVNDAFTQQLVYVTLTDDRGKLYRIVLSELQAWSS